jgi:hypothetical protein
VLLLTMLVQVRVLLLHALIVQGLKSVWLNDNLPWAKVITAVICNIGYGSIMYYDCNHY